MLIFENTTIDHATEINGILDNMSDAAFARFCQKNKDLRIERDKHRKVIVMPPVHADTGRKESEAQGRLFIWNLQTKLGKVFSSSTGFTLPNGAMRSADAAWIALEKWESLPMDERKSFARIVPDFVIEIRSASDRLRKVEEKMEEWLENGARLGWLIDLQGEQTFIYRKGQPRETVFGLDKTLSGEGVLPDFEFSLTVLA